MFTSQSKSDVDMFFLDGKLVGSEFVRVGLLQKKRRENYFFGACDIFSGIRLLIVSRLRVICNKNTGSRGDEAMFLRCAERRLE